MRRSRCSHEQKGRRVREYMNCLRAPAFLCILLWPASAAYAQDKVPAQECCLEMLFPIGARTVALGQAVTAQPQTDAPFVNPAGLADLAKSQIVIHRTSVADAKQTSFEVLIHSRVAGNFAVAYTGLEFAPDTATSETGEVTGSTDIFKQTVTATYATTIAYGWTAGVNYRLFHSGLNCVGNCGDAAKGGTTQMIDVGVRYQPRPLPNLVLGASVMHAGFPLQVNNAAQADVTPARLRVGGAYNIRGLVSKDSTIAVWLSVDVVQRIRDAGTPAINTGLEVVLDNTIFLRAGHASGANGITSGGSGVGLGLTYQRFDVSVAKAVSAGPVFPDPVYVSFGITF